MPEISVILSTARDGHPIIGLPEVHVLQPTLKSLQRQTFRDFELIIVDALYPSKREWIEQRRWGFPIKYVPPHPNHRYWVGRGLWGVCEQLNSALLYCEGELVVRVDDCSEIPDRDYLRKFWELYQSGYFPMAMHVRYHAGRPARVNEEYLKEGYEARFSQMPGEDRAMLLKRLYGEGGVVRDTRWPTVERRGRMTAPPEWFYGYSGFSLEAALKINGFNELFDGVKGQEDQDFGIRLDMAGYREVFLLDKDLWVIEHEHYPPKVSSPQPFKCNYGLIQYTKRKGLYKANTWTLRLEDCEWIRRNICPNCLNYERCLGERLGGRFYVEEDPLFGDWLEHQNTFSLREERLSME